MSNDRFSLEANIQAFNARENELKIAFPDKYLVFCDGQLQDSFDTFDEAAHFAVDKFQDGPYLIRQVGLSETIPMPASVAWQPLPCQ